MYGTVHNIVYYSIMDTFIYYIITVHIILLRITSIRFTQKKNYLIYLVP